MITKEEVLKLIQQGKTEELVALGPEAYDTLFRGLANEFPSRRSTCCRALVEIAKKDQDVFERLMSDTSGNYSYTSVQLRIKKCHLWILGEVGDTRVVPYLFSFLDRSPHEFEESISIALAKIARTNEETFQRLINEILHIKDRKIKAQCSCIRALCLLKDSRTSEVLIKTFSSSFDSAVLGLCEKTLAEIAKTDENTLELLIQTLKNNLDPNVKFHCAMALGTTNRADLIDILVTMSFIDKDLDLKFACTRALGNIKDPRGLAFKKVIYDKDKDYALKMGIEKTRATIKEYLELIKNYYSKERVGAIKIELHSFFREVFEKATDLKPCMDLPELKIKPPKRGPEICARLMTVRV
ncbi:MAG: HEAT repeat domain-containing protein [Candidatus Micrarchaeia archaeon]